MNQATIDFAFLFLPILAGILVGFKLGGIWNTARLKRVPSMFDFPLMSRTPSYFKSKYSYFKLMPSYFDQKNFVRLYEMEGKIGPILRKDIPSYFEERIK